ncbi:hypothetical protein [Spongiimicrobium salis]|uniref:hypothetical protein n=1 Tax=Spongiimicrobium salis TaxID=1667022 RepID=UPI00374D8E3D
MKTLVVILTLALCCCAISTAQEIEMKTTIFGYRFTQNGARLSWKELSSATESNLDAHLLIKKARSQNTISSILSFAGGFLIGIPIGQSIGDRDPNWSLAYIGGGIAAIGIPFTFSAFNKVNKGIDTYNLSLKATSRYQFKPEFTILAKGNGLGFIMRF